MSKEKKKLVVVLGLSVGLPSTILGICLFVMKLIDEQVVSKSQGLIIILIVVINIFYLMVRSVLKSKNK